MFFIVIRLVGELLFFLGMVLSAISQFLVLLAIDEINSRRPAGQQIKILDLVSVWRHTRREKRRLIMRIHRDLFPASTRRDSIDNTQFFGALSLFMGLAMIVISASS